MTSTVVDYTKSLVEIPCNLCGSNDFTTIYPARYDHAMDEEKLQDSFKSSGDEILMDRLVKCNNCGLQYLNPRLNETMIINSYSSGSDEIFISQIDGRERTFRKCLDILEKFVLKRDALLDVGTAGGSFLGVAKERGWQVSGCEPSKWLTEWGNTHYGLNIQVGTIFDMHLDANSKNVITLWDVIEHTADPKNVLQECHRVLKNDGILLLVIPDIGSLVSKIMRRKWVFLLSVHLYYFTYQTMKAMLEKTGFTVIYTKK
ncbi:MAG: methyltransferase domain-containing protein, partial [Elusimicrobia bacterium]|nr:methyltransferase domain-containing protein [Elusimicrobiota bacterium]